jgi:hypothetical protein
MTSALSRITDAATKISIKLSGGSDNAEAVGVWDSADAVSALSETWHDVSCVSDTADAKSMVYETPRMHLRKFPLFKN